MISGVHHITAIASDPRRNVQFYRDLLGLRLVKQTVNFDDPGTYHLYFGDRLGLPGTILTFFPWPGARRGSRGVGQATTATFAVPRDALDFWRHRFASQGVLMADPEERFGDSVLRFFDPDGLELELCTDLSAPSETGWEVEDIPAEAAIRGLQGVTLREAEATATGRFLMADLGFVLAEETTVRRRYRLEGGGPGRTIDVVAEPTVSYGSIAAGSIHHVAWRVPDVAAQKAARVALIGRGHLVSQIMDRQYFQSIYFREPGGVLFEIATDPPGFMVDEAPERLGSTLQLPPWLEAERDSIVARLPALDEARPTVAVEV